MGRDPGLPPQRARRRRGRPGRRRGAGRPARRRGGPRPPGAPRAGTVGGVGRHRRRLRAHRGDAAAPCPARGARLVHGARLPGGAPHRQGAPPGPEPGRRGADAAGHGLRRDAAPARRARRGARAAHRAGGERPGGPDPGVRGAGGGQAVADRSLSLFGYRVDGVVVNRIFPSTEADEWRAGWVRSQEAVLAEVAESFAGMPLWRSVYRSGEPVGVDALRALARGGVRRHRPARRAGRQGAVHGEPHVGSGRRSGCPCRTSPAPTWTSRATATSSS